MDCPCCSPAAADLTSDMKTRLAIMKFIYKMLEVTGSLIEL